jgi:ubiquinone/menaquinone biosynthesis C-methylase UbiE
MRMISKTYICPDCREWLAEEDRRYSCAQCSKVYPKVGNIPAFDNPENYYGEIPKDKMNDLIEMAGADGYRKAISVFLTDPFVRTYALDEDRARWADLLPLETVTRVLDVGCGWGTTTIPIARKVGHVAAIDATLERVKFVELRARQCGLSNVAPAMASAVALPYPDASFDIVIFNGVLEWLGAIDIRNNPMDIQLRAMREAHRVLAPGGTIYIGIENRFSLRYFLGSPDDHSYIRFTSLMPRRLAEAYCKLRTGNHYYTHTHSLSSYRRMLKDTGFTCAREYHPWPNYRNPLEFAELKKDEITAHLRREIQRTPVVSRKRLYLSLLKWLTEVGGDGRFCHSFLFIYRKGG